MHDNGYLRLCEYPGEDQPDLQRPLDDDEVDSLVNLVQGFASGTAGTDQVSQISIVCSNGITITIDLP